MKPTSAVDLALLARPDEVEREISNRAAEQRILRRYFAGDDVYGACPLPVLAFHKDPRRNRVLVGANKSAKTVGGVVDVALQCAGRHPFRKRLKPPLACRAVAPELPGTMENPHVQRDTFREWIPPRWLRGGSWEDAYAVQAGVLYFANGSFVEFLSSAQDVLAHAGERRHIIWFDEEMPHDIYAENVARLAKGLALGEWLLTYVPLGWQAWIETDLYRPGLEDAKSGIGVHHVVLADNAHNLPAGFIEQFTASLGGVEAEIKMRVHGLYATRTGKVYDSFGAENVVEGDFEVAR